VLESFVQYRQPLAFDDEITVHLRLAAVTRATFQMAYLITVADDAGVARPRATGVTVHGCVTTAGRPTRLPAWLTEMAAGEAHATRAV
jgi:acyl-CoA thioester hydrolase